MDRYRMLPSYRYYDVEGTSPLTLDKSVGKPLRDYKIYGNSIQDGTPSPDNPIEIQSCGDKSKNLFNEKLLLKHDGIEKTEEGYLAKQYPVVFNTVQGYDSARDIVDSIKSILKPNVVYTLSRKTANYVGGADGAIQFLDGSATKIIACREWTGRMSVTFSLSQEQIDSIASIYVYGHGGSTPILFEYIQLEEGETATEYEPYGYKIPIEVGGKNLLDMSKVTNGYLNQTGAIITPSPEYRVTDFIDVSNMSNITITAAKSYAFYDENKTFISGEVKSLTIFRSYAVPANAKYIRFDWQPANANNIVYAVAGNYTEDTFPPYEPYKEPIKTNVYLDEPLYKIGDYADYIDFMNGKVVRNIFEYTFVGNEFSSGVPFADLGTTICTYTKTIIDGKIPTEVRGFSEKGVFDGKVINANDNERCEFAYNSGAKRTCFYARILKSRCANPDSPTSADFNNIYSAGTKIYGVLATPTETPITLPTIPTHKGTNVISVPTDIQPSNMQIQYYK